jgi:uncharacterized protein YyaL (SSP411 family)
MLHHRNGRIKPGLDDKRLTSWNALAVTGFLAAYNAFGDKRFISNANATFEFIRFQMQREDGGLFHSWKPKSTPINGFLEDYAFAIAAAVDFYQVTFDFRYIQIAVNWMRYCIDHFFDDLTGLFRFVSDLDTPLFATKVEYQDNVIPASNSQMAQNLFALSYYTGNPDWEKMSRKMVQTVVPMAKAYGSAFSNWLDLSCRMQLPMEEIVICGRDASEYMNHLHQKHYIPFSMVDGAVAESNTPATKGRIQKGKTFLYRCRDHVCDAPVDITNGLDWQDGLSFL